jgi:uncharacterized protein (DUF58 family)
MISLLLIIGLLFLELGLWGIQGEGWVRGHPETLSPGSKSRVRFNVRLRALLPVYYRLELPRALEFGWEGRQLRGLAFGELNLHEDLLAIPRRRGHPTLPAPRLFVQDLLGLFEREIRLRVDQGKLWVVPRSFGALKPDLALTLLAEGPEIPGVGLEDPHQLRGLRDYLPGDPPKRIHWRSSARRGLLTVREYARVRATGVWIHLEAKEAPEVYLEHASELAASLLLAASQEGIRFGLSFGAKQIPLGLGEPHLRSCLRLLAEVQAEAEEHPVPMPPPGVNLILITYTAPLSLLEGALAARSQAARVHLVALPEGFFLRPGERGRELTLGRTDGVLRLHKARRFLEQEGVWVHLLRGNDPWSRLVS